MNKLVKPSLLLGTVFIASCGQKTAEEPLSLPTAGQIAGTPTLMVSDHAAFRDQSDAFLNAHWFEKIDRSLEQIVDPDGDGLHTSIELYAGLHPSEEAPEFGPQPIRVHFQIMSQSSRLACHLRETKSGDYRVSSVQIGTKRYRYDEDTDETTIIDNALTAPLNQTILQGNVILPNLSPSNQESYKTFFERCDELFKVYGRTPE